MNLNSPDSLKGTEMITKIKRKRISITSQTSPMAQKDGIVFTALAAS